MLKAVVHHILDGPAHSIPVKSEELTDHLPGNQLGPGGQHHTKSGEKRAFALCPGDSLHPHGAIGTRNASGCAEQNHGNSPEGNMLQSSLFQFVVARCFGFILRADGLKTAIGTQPYGYPTSYRLSHQ
jgi:hypothetical protein